MNTPSPLRVPYHLQDQDSYCGCATAQMIVSTFDPQLPLQDQSAIEGLVSSSGWYAAPDPLSTVLNLQIQGVTGFSYHAWRGDPLRLTYKLVWTLHHHRVPVAATVWMNSHWVVVNGYSASRAPEDPQDTDFDILQLHVLNPRYRSITPPPPPHGGNDRCPRIGLQDWWVDYADWTRYTFTNAAGEVHCIADATPPPASVLAPPVERPDLGEAGLRAAMEVTGVTRYFTEDFVEGEAVRVERLDEDRSYEIIPLRAALGGEEILALVISSGNRYGQTAVIPAGHPYRTRMPIPTVEQARQTIRSLQEQGLPGLPQGEPLIHNVPVWAPGEGTGTQFEPFLRVQLGETELFYRDGRIFERPRIQKLGG